MDNIAAIWNNLDWSVITNIIIRTVPALLCITLHEVSHGYAAFFLGDTTARNSGRLTLNPIRHIDPLGLLSMIVFRFGWAKPVPVNMYYFKNQRLGMAVTAAAGPVVNLLLAVFTLFLYGILFPLCSGRGAFAFFLLDIISNTSYLSLALCVFNFVPIPPLDGSKILFAFLPERYYHVLMRIEKYGMIILIVLISFSSLNGSLSKAISWLYARIFFFAEAGYKLALKW